MDRLDPALAFASPAAAIDHRHRQFGKSPWLAKLIAAEAPAASPVRDSRINASGVSGRRQQATAAHGYQVLSPDELAAISQAH